MKFQLHKESDTALSAVPHRLWTVSRQPPYQLQRTGTTMITAQNMFFRLYRIRMKATPYLLLIASMKKFQQLLQI
jgi:hypothetical protein